MNSTFSLNLLSQFWIDQDRNNETDLCSHGTVYLNVGDHLLSTADNGDWTVVSASLRLMRSALFGYQSKGELEILPHCGGLRLFPSCPTYITWDVDLTPERAVLSKVQCSSNDEKGLITLDGTFEVPYGHYVSEILSFADQVLSFYGNALPRKFEKNWEDWEKEEYDLFWTEFHEYHTPLKKKVLR